MFYLKGFFFVGDLQMRGGGGSVAGVLIPTLHIFPHFPWKGGGVDGHYGLNFPAQDIYSLGPIVPNVLSYSLYEVAQSQLVTDRISPPVSVWIYIRPGIL